MNDATGVGTLHCTCVCMYGWRLSDLQEYTAQRVCDQAIKPVDLVKIKYRTLKSGAVGESIGFKFLWIPFVSPNEADAKRDMLDRLQKEGIDTKGKNMAYTNATSDRGGFGIIGLIGTPTITLTSDVVEILGEASPRPLIQLRPESLLRQNLSLTPAGVTNEILSLSTVPTRNFVSNRRVLGLRGLRLRDYAERPGDR